MNRVTMDSAKFHKVTILQTTFGDARSILNLRLIGQKNRATSSVLCVPFHTNDQNEHPSIRY